MYEKLAHLNITSEYQQNSTQVKRTEIGKIPQEWKVVKTGEVCTSIVPGRNKPKVFDGDIPWITIPDIDSLMLSVSKIGLAVSREELKRAKGKTIPPNTVVMTCVGTFGIAAVTTREVVINQQLHGFVCNEDVLPLYLCWILRSKEAEMISLAGKTTIPYLNREKCESIHFALPPLHEQKQIAAILSSVDEAIASTQAVIDQTRKVKQGLLQQLLTRGIGHTKFKESAIGEIPKAWDVAELREVSFIVRGSTPRPAKDPRYFNGDHIPWITVSEISKDEWPYLIQTESFLTEEGKKQSRLIPKGTVILKNSGYGLGVPKILALDGCANDGIAAFLELDINLEPRFLYYFLYSMTKEFRRAIARGVDQPNLNTELIGGVKIPIPPLKEQEKIVETLFSCDELIRETENTATRYLDLKRGLMQDLLTGRVRVKDTSSV